MSSAEFSPLTFIYPSATPIYVNYGEVVNVILRFTYKGSARSVYIGIGVATPKSPWGHYPPITYILSYMNLAASQSYVQYEKLIRVRVPSGFSSGQKFDIQGFISNTQPELNQQPPNDYGINKWQDDVIILSGVVDIPEPAFRNLIVVSYC